MSLKAAIIEFCVVRIYEMVIKSLCLSVNPRVPSSPAASWPQPGTDVSPSLSVCLSLSLSLFLPLTLPTIASSLLSYNFLPSWCCSDPSSLILVTLGGRGGTRIRSDAVIMHHLKIFEIFRNLSKYLNFSFNWFYKAIQFWIHNSVFFANVPRKIHLNFTALIKHIETCQ